MEGNQKAYYRIADIQMMMESDLSFDVFEENSAPFRTGEAHPDYVYRICKTSDIPKHTGVLNLVDTGILCDELINEQKEIFRGFRYRDYAQYYDVMASLGEKESIIYYLDANEIAERFRSGYDVASFFSLEHVLLRHGALFLHSSHLNIGGKALLFSAPSGTGKSTQADLWEKYACAEIINGDKTVLRKKDGIWNAYGCPMCGTSGIHKQGNEPIHAIVMLEQGKDNSVRRLTAGEAFSRMYPEVTVPRWNRELVLRAMELLDDVMANVPVYLFSCTKDKCAVMALRDALKL